MASARSAFIVSRVGFPLSIVSMTMASRCCSRRSAILLRMIARAAVDIRPHAGVAACAASSASSTSSALERDVAQVLPDNRGWIREVATLHQCAILITDPIVVARLDRDRDGVLSRGVRERGVGAVFGLTVADMRDPPSCIGKRRHRAEPRVAEYATSQGRPAHDAFASVGDVALSLVPPYDAAARARSLSRDSRVCVRHSHRIGTGNAPDASTRSSAHRTDQESRPPPTSRRVQLPFTLMNRESDNSRFMNYE